MAVIDYAQESGMWRDISAVEAQCQDLDERLEKIEGRPPSLYARDHLLVRTARGVASFIGSIVFMYITLWTATYCFVWAAKKLDPRREAAAIYYLREDNDI